MCMLVNVLVNTPSMSIVEYGIPACKSVTRGNIFFSLGSNAQVCMKMHWRD